MEGFFSGRAMRGVPVINDENGDDVECDADPHGGAEDGDKRPQRLPVEGIRVHQQTLVLKWNGGARTFVMRLQTMRPSQTYI